MLKRLSGVPAASRQSEGAAHGALALQVPDSVLHAQLECSFLLPCQSRYKYADRPCSLTDCISLLFDTYRRSYTVHDSMWSEESSDSDSDVEAASAAYSPNPLYEDRSISRPITPVTPKKSFFQASKDELIMHFSVYLLNSPRLCACASYAEHQDDALEDSASNDPIAMGVTVHVSHSSNDSNNCSATASATADTAHKSSTSRCSQRYVDATGVAALCTVSCEDSYDDTCRDSREPSDAAAAAAAADTTASIIVTSKHSPRSIELMLALHLSLRHTRVACAHNRVLQSCYDAPMPVAAGAALNKRLSQLLESDTDFIIALVTLITQFPIPPTAQPLTTRHRKARHRLASAVVNRDPTNTSSGDTATQQQQQQQSISTGFTGSDTTAAHVQFVHAGELSGGVVDSSNANGKPTAGANRRSFKLKNMHISAKYCYNPDDTPSCARSLLVSLLLILHEHCRHISCYYLAGVCYNYNNYTRARVVAATAGLSIAMMKQNSSITAVAPALQHHGGAVVAVAVAVEVRVYQQRYSLNTVVAVMAVTVNSSHAAVQENRHQEANDQHDHHIAHNCKDMQHFSL
eukprot:10040-Heterococcus_DN1.PRE.2